MYLIRACNMDKVSVVGERPAPRCSKWTEDWLVGGAGAVTTNGVAGKIDYLIINDEWDADAAYVYKLTDDGDGVTTVEATELSLIATIAMSADGDLSTTEVLIA